MKRMCLSLALSALVVGMAASQPVRAADENAAPKWTDNYKAAVSQAKKEKKMLLLDFTGSDWCGYCIKLHDMVFSKPEFSKWADKFVLVELDFPQQKKLSDAVKAQNDQLQKKYQIEGFPTVIILDASEKKLAETVGYGGESPSKWMAAIDDQVAKGK